MKNSKIKWTRRASIVLLLSIVTACASAPVALPVRQPGETVAYIVRHAEKVTTARDNPDPAISSHGRVRADQLAERLGGAGVTRIIVTDLQRTQQTAAPLAAKLGITPEIIPVTVSGHADSVAATIMHHRGESILVVGHSVTVPAIIEALGGPKFPTICDSQYSDMFVVHISESGTTKVDHLHYGPADALNAACALP